MSLRTAGPAAFLGALLLLAGCARLPPAAERDDALAQALPRFSVDGKVAWRSPEDAGRATLSWSQDGPRARLVLSGPFGAGAAVLEDDGDGARLAIGDREHRAAEAGALLEAELGLPLPVREARHWVLGTVAPGPARVLRRDPAGRPARIEQAGWTVAFEERRSVDGFALPRRVEMSRGSLRLRFVATRWRPLVADFPAGG